MQITPLAMSGFRLEHIRLETKLGYEFCSRSEDHYLALHDLTLVDGELCVEGQPAVRGTDLRGTVTYVPSGCGINGWAKPADRSNSFTILYIDPAGASDMLAERFRRFSPEPLIYSRNPALIQTMVKLGRVLESGAGDELYAEALCLAAAIEIFAASDAPRAGRLSAAQMQRIRTFIEDQLAEKLSLEAVANFANLSRFHFSRAFKASFGSGLHEYIQKRRIERAQDFLRSTSLHPDRVSELVGFPSPAAFRRSFLRATGVSPLKFRHES